MLRGIPKSEVASWRDKRIFVLGDVMLDRFVSGRVERLSPEAPIPLTTTVMTALGIKLERHDRPP